MVHNTYIASTWLYKLTKGTYRLTNLRYAFSLCPAPILFKVSASEIYHIYLLNFCRPTLKLTLTGPRVEFPFHLPTHAFCTAFRDRKMTRNPFNDSPYRRNQSISYSTLSRSINTALDWPLNGLPRLRCST